METMEALVAAIAEVEALYDGAAAFVDEYADVWQNTNGSWRDWESEAEGREAEATMDAYARVLIILRRAIPTEQVK